MTRFGWTFVLLLVMSVVVHDVLMAEAGHPPGAVSVIAVEAPHRDRSDHADHHADNDQSHPEQYPESCGAARVVPSRPSAPDHAPLLDIIIGPGASPSLEVPSRQTFQRVWWPAAGNPNECLAVFQVFRI